MRRDEVVPGLARSGELDARTRDSGMRGDQDLTRRRDFGAGTGRGEDLHDGGVRIRLQRVQDLDARTERLRHAREPPPQHVGREHVQRRAVLPREVGRRDPAEHQHG